MDWLAFIPEWFVLHGPAFLIVLPLMMAAVTAILPNKGVAWTAGLIVTGLCTLSAFAMLAYNFEAGTMLYKLGGWAPPHGISLVIDALNAPILALITSLGFLTIIYALPATAAEIKPNKRAPFYAAFLLCFAGLLGMVVTGDAFNVFVFLEVSSISTYVLVAMGAARDRRALAAAYNYLILGSIGATFFVVGIGFLYMETGTLNMADISRVLADLNGGSRVAKVGFAFIVVGLGLKLAMFPLHTWLSGAYAYAPTPVTAFLASTATKAALYLLLRFVFLVFDPSFDYVADFLEFVLVGAGIIGMMFASTKAIFQTDVRRLLALSSVAQIGYMVLGIGMATTASVAAGYLHLINHAIIKGGLFFALGAMWYRFGITRIEDFRGLGKTMPLTMGAFTISGLSLVGVPFTAGFVSKINLASAAASLGWWWAVGAIMLSSILALIYVGRILLSAYFQSPPKIDGHEVARHEAPISMLFPMWFLAFLSVLIGVHSDIVVGISVRAAQFLLGTGG